MDAILQLIGSSGPTTSLIGVLLLLFFTMRKQEATVRAEQISTIDRLRSEVAELDASKDKSEALAEDLRHIRNEKDLEIIRLKTKLLKAGIDPDDKE